MNNQTLLKRQPGCESRLIMQWQPGSHTYPMKLVPGTGVKNINIDNKRNLESQARSKSLSKDALVIKSHGLSLVFVTALVHVSTSK